jgi:hypothetical protein
MWGGCNAQVLQLLHQLCRHQLKMGGGAGGAVGGDLVEGDEFVAEVHLDSDALRTAKRAQEAYGAWQQHSVIFLS